MERFSSKTLAGMALLALTGLPSSALAKTPDGNTPAEESVCEGLPGAAFGLCNAYCEAQDCDVHARPFCAQLRRNFQKVTGSPIFPCDAPVCGDGVVGRGEECDPPTSLCASGTACQADCTCALPTSCLNRILDLAAQCTAPCGTTVGACVGDCDGTAEVDISELALGCQIVEGGGPASQCPSLDVNSDGKVAISELACAACNFALGCP